MELVKQETQEPSEGLLVATYGTLRYGCGNWRNILDNPDVEYLGEQRTEPKYKMVSLGGFPGVILNGTQEVTIDVFRVKSKRIEQRLDNLEGYPSFYQKAKLPTKWGEAEMYILSESEFGDLPVIQTGDWKNRN